MTAFLLFYQIEFAKMCLKIIHCRWQQAYADWAELPAMEQKRRADLMAAIPEHTGPERNRNQPDEEKYDEAVAAVCEHLRQLRLWPLVSELKVYNPVHALYLHARLWD